MPSSVSPTPQGIEGTSSQPSPSIPDLRDRLPKLQPRRRQTPPSNSTPIPTTPALPSPPELTNHRYKRPCKRILSQKDHELFLSSPTFSLILAFVFGIADSIVDTPVSAIAKTELSSTIEKILQTLDKVEEVVVRSPPEDQGDSRFGNKGFRDFLDLLQREQPGWQRDLGVLSEEAIAEVSMYFGESFGNRTRIDYGSGHELNFIIWLLCLYQLGILRTSDFKAAALVVFVRYIKLMRTIQTIYYLEPAGSHGVWGLDDYQFLPFLFGASQLLHHPYIRPKSIHQALTLEQFGEDYLYLGQVNFVNSIKNVEGLRWHSPMLDDISSAKNWAKIEGGMRRMFVAEVLQKLPVMQHFLFGSLVPAAEGMSEAPTQDEDELKDDAEHGKIVVEHEGKKHLHDLNAWGDCCGIKVPSSIAAAQEQKKRMGAAEGLRRIPFD